FGSAKCWLPERFAELAGELARRGVCVVLIGGNAERELARKIRMLAPHPEQLKNLAGETSLEDLVALIAAADVLVANDSGPMHVAGAVGTPVVALFGSTNEKETYPLTENGKLRLIKAPGIACSPCKLRECPIDHRCMRNIPVARVMAETEAVLFAEGKAVRS
ncbi:MAG: glycosyltransferase family 9 protein, partial [Terriglobales bacterium]